MGPGSWAPIWSSPSNGPLRGFCDNDTREENRDIDATARMNDDGGREINDRSLTRRNQLDGMTFSLDFWAAAARMPEWWLVRRAAGLRSAARAAAPLLIRTAC